MAPESKRPYATELLQDDFLNLSIEHEDDNYPVPLNESSLQRILEDSVEHQSNSRRPNGQSEKKRNHNNNH